MRDFGQWIGLVHELAELTRPKKLPHSRGSRLCIDHVLRHDRINFNRAHPFFNRALHAQQAQAVLVLHQFTN